MEPTKETLRAKWIREGPDIGYKYESTKYNHSCSFYTGNIADWWLSHTLDPDELLAFIEKQFEIAQKAYLKAQKTKNIKAMALYVGELTQLTNIRTFIRSKMRE